MSLSIQVANLIAENSELKAALARCQRANASNQTRTVELRQAIFDAVKESSLSIEIPKAPKRVPSRRAEVALLHLTDWQLGKRTESYNIDVCKTRVMTAVSKTAKIRSLRDVPVNEVVLLLGGDMVEGGTIFPGQPWEVEAGIYSQLLETSALVAAVVVELLGIFSKVTVIEEFGNHGRIGRRGELPAEDNIDLIAYRIAETIVGPRARLTWKRATTWHQIVEIGAYRALLVHGDEIRSWGGNHPVYGIVRKVASWQSGVIGTFVDCYMGHFHRPDTYTLPSGGSVYLTGSPESGNEYAREFLAATGRPSQRLNFIDPRKGQVTSEHRLWLD